MRRGRGGGSEFDDAFGGVGVLAEEERGVADGADAGDASFGLNTGNEGGALVTVRTFKAKFYELTSVDELGEQAEEGGREAGFADFDGGFEGLAETAEAGFLRAGERWVFHVSGDEGGKRRARNR